MRTKPATLLVSFATVALAIFLWSSAWASDSELKIEGLAGVPPTGLGGALTLPLAPGSAPVTLLVSLGEPAVLVAVQITPSTAIEAEALPVTLVDGDRVTTRALFRSADWPYNGVIVRAIFTRFGMRIIAARAGA